MIHYWGVEHEITTAIDELQGVSMTKGELPTA
jgi:hypothetical protein